MIKFGISLATVFLLFLSGCERPTQTAATTTASSEPSIVLLSVTSDAKEDPQSVDMALKLAGFSLDEQRQVVIFFNVKGVTIPVNDFADEFAFGSNDPIKSQLVDLIKRGADIHVCPICMKALDVNDSDVIEGAHVTTRPKLFSNIGANTSVFTY